MGEDRPMTGSGLVKIGVVVDHWNAVGRQTHIQLNRIRAKFNCALKCRGRILRCFGRNPAMGNDLKTGHENSFHQIPGTSRYWT
jgi:hypothetical protein